VGVRETNLLSMSTKKTTTAYHLHDEARMRYPHVLRKVATMCREKCAARSALIQLARVHVADLVSASRSDCFAHNATRSTYKYIVMESKTIYRM
jgi:hypothetical protein